MRLSFVVGTVSYESDAWIQGPSLSAPCPIPEPRPGFSSGGVVRAMDARSAVVLPQGLFVTGPWVCCPYFCFLGLVMVSISGAGGRGVWGFVLLGGGVVVAAERVKPWLRVRKGQP